VVRMGNTARKADSCLAASTAPTPVSQEQALVAVVSVRPYMSIEQLAAATPWTDDAIRHKMARGILKLGVHYFQPLGRRTEIIFKWSAIVDMIEQQPVLVEEPETVQARSRATKGIDVEQATANFERLLG
jgi:hypothetical protein